MKKLISALLTFAFIAGNSFCVGAETLKPNELQTQTAYISVTPFASDVLSGWVPSVSASKFSASDDRAPIERGARL